MSQFLLTHPLTHLLSHSSQAMEEGLTNDELFELTKIDPWWLAQLRELFDVRWG